MNGCHFHDVTADAPSRFTQLSPEPGALEAGALSHLLPTWVVLYSARSLASPSSKPGSTKGLGSMAMVMHTQEFIHTGSR